MGKIVQRLWIDGKLPGLNDYTKANRSNMYQGANLKKTTEAVVAANIQADHIKPVDGPVTLHYTWHEPNKRRDKDNIAFAQKFVQDALVKSGVLKGDGWEHITGFRHDFVVSRTPGVNVEIWEDNA